jgi:hypothetical protein
LEKVEDKYKQVFKEHKALSKDREVLEKVLTSFLNEAPYKL